MSYANADSRLAVVLDAYICKLYFVTGIALSHVHKQAWPYLPANNFPIKCL